MGTFEERLLGNLMAEHGAELAEGPAPRRRRGVRPLWIAGAAAAVAGLVFAGVSVLGEGPPAFAVTKDNDGKVTITIKEFGAIDALNKELGRMGVPMRALPVTKDCKDRIDPAQQVPDILRFGIGPKVKEVSFHTNEVKPGATLLIGVSKPLHGGGTEPTWTLTFQVRGPIPGCLLSPA
ncbi:hypothetical protein [Crossiella cryophila]|uniref:Uncharacterized protein n=1 Tax=Crossiella cryophila TaxID=43355 RepID=A0A7W7CEW8_9PSEU|nr:hypothetical protein [Crossiella cryophila]MBB4679945.1 hypothetical protein [Crossiella cryophila]